jgi:hypothetical protein
MRLLRARVGAYRADVALFPDSGLVHGLLKLEPPWTILYRDMTAVLLAPPNSPLIAAHPDPAVVLADEPQFLRYQARKAYTAGELDAAIGLLERGPRRSPGASGQATARASRAARRRADGSRSSAPGHGSTRASSSNDPTTTNQDVIGKSRDTTGCEMVDSR